jgi:hypothetical protein
LPSKSTCDATGRSGSALPTRPRRTEDVEIRWWPRLAISQFVLARAALPCASCGHGRKLVRITPKLGGYRSCDLPTSQLRRGHDDRERRIGRPFQNSATPMDTRYARSRCLHAGLLAIGVELGSNDKHRSEAPH